MLPAVRLQWGGYSSFGYCREGAAGIGMAAIPTAALVFSAPQPAGFADVLHWLL